MQPHCKKIVEKILPAIRSQLISGLQEKHDMTQGQIAEKLGLTQPAVSQALSRESSEIEKKIEKSDLKSEIEDLADRLANEEPDLRSLLDRLCDICEKTNKLVE